MWIAVFVLLVVIPALVIASFPIHAARALRRARPRHTPSIGRASVIMPLAGSEDALETCVQRLLAQRATFDIELIFCVHDPRDPAVAVVQRCLANSGRSASILTAGEIDGAPGKMSNLIAGVAAASGDLLVFVDSDTVFDDESFVQRLAEDACAPGVGLVTCIPAYRGAADVPAALLASMINFDLPGYFAMADCWTRFRLANGSCMAVPRRVLNAVGGLQQLQNHLLMDTKLAQHVVAGGWHVRLHAFPVPVVKQHATWSEWWHQVMRWQIAMWHSLGRATYVAFVWMRSGGVAAAALIALAPPHLQVLAWCGAALYVAARIASASLLNAIHLRDPHFARHVWLLPGVEVFNFVTAIAAMFSTRVTWRGRRYAIQRGGIVRAMREPPGPEERAERAATIR